MEIWKSLRNSLEVWKSAENPKNPLIDYCQDVNRLLSFCVDLITSIYASVYFSLYSHHYDRGDVTILAVNINATSNVFFNLTGTLKGLAADQYLLQAQDGDVTSQLVS